MNKCDSQIDQSLRQAGKRLKLSAILVNASWWLAVSLAWWLVVFVLDNVFSLPAGLRLPLALGGAALVGAAFIKKVVAVLKVRQRPERTAVMLEQRYGIADNVLINACHFEKQTLRAEEQAFARQTVDMGRGLDDPHPLCRLVGPQTPHHLGNRGRPFVAGVGRLHRHLPAPCLERRLALRDSAG